MDYVFDPDNAFWAFWTWVWERHTNTKNPKGWCARHLLPNLPSLQHRLHLQQAWSTKGLPYTVEERCRVTQMTATKVSTWICILPWTSSACFLMVNDSVACHMYRQGQVLTIIFCLPGSWRFGPFGCSSRRRFTHLLRSTKSKWISKQQPSSIPYSWWGCIGLARNSLMHERWRRSLLRCAFEHASEMIGSKSSFHWKKPNDFTNKDVW